MSEAIEIVNAEPEVIELAVDFDSEVSARDAEAWAVGKRGGVDVSEDDPTYHNNSKYYSEFAESEAQEAIDTIRTAAEEIRDDSIVAINQAAEEARESIPADYAELSDDVTELKSAFALFQENIPGTVQTIAFDSAGNVQSITHMEGITAVRTDVFTFGASTITEVRTLATGESLTIITNTDTLETTTTYAAA